MGVGAGGVGVGGSLLHACLPEAGAVTLTGQYGAVRAQTLPASWHA